MPYVQIAAGAAAVLFLAVAVFQGLLAWGLPLGEAAWGGAARILPTRLRVASAIALFVWLGFACVVLAHAGVLSLGLDEGLVGVATWVIVVFLAVGTAMNAASRSGTERRIWTPVAALAFFLTLAVAVWA